MSTPSNLSILAINVAQARALLLGEHLAGQHEVRARESDADKAGSVLSAIHKTSISTLANAARIAVTVGGVAGDEQADRSVHGGLHMAVYAYPVEHYAFWNTVRQQAAHSQTQALQEKHAQHLAQSALFETAPTSSVSLPSSPPLAPLAFGSLGENLTLQGLLETQLWIGDQLHVKNKQGETTCVLVVTRPREPCFKFNARMGFKHASKMMAQSGFSGFYLAVQQAGSLAAGDAIEVVAGERQVNLAEQFRVRMRGAGKA